jgi:DNA mismatch endonuclease (patch repair protein)
MDTLSRETRSLVMARVKSKRNRSTEWRLRALLIRTGLRGWKVSGTNLRGSPDFVFDAERLVIFADGCFWHGCPRCKKLPASNISYWHVKIARNRRRDRATTAFLRRQGWTVLRFWEHELRSLSRVAATITGALFQAQSHSDKPGGAAKSDLPKIAVALR